MDIVGRLAQANGRLKASMCRCRIEVSAKNRLCLRGTLPPKPDARNQKPHQQRIYLGVNASPDGIKYAEAQARKVSALLDCKEFRWGLTQVEAAEDANALPPQLTISQLIEDFKSNYFHQRRGNDERITKNTWLGEYQSIYRHLPADDILTEEILLEVIDKFEPDSRTRKRACIALNRLARTAGLSLDLMNLAGNYGIKSVQPRDLPSDKEIARWWGRIPNQTWQWFYGMMATFGLRNHEVFRLAPKFEEGDSVMVLKGKTGYRQVWPFYPEWVDEFNLLDIKMPNVDKGRTNASLGCQSSGYFNRIGLPFHLYDLRHCWAFRSMRFGLPDALSAKQMGHSIEIHNRYYCNWITSREQQMVVDALLARENRPLPPT